MAGKIMGAAPKITRTDAVLFALVMILALAAVAWASWPHLALSVNGSSQAGQREMEGVVYVNGRARLNLNTASTDQLEELPGIGKTLAGRIVEYREQNGLFESVEELILVDGIDTGLLRELIGKIGVGD